MIPENPEGRLALGCLRTLPPHDQVSAFCGLMEEEIAPAGPASQNAALLRNYYRRLFGTKGKLIPVQVFGYGERLRPLLEALSRRPSTARILDAGSGYGTESLLFALLGYDVVGVELVAKRAALARARTPFFESKCSSPLRLDFVNANILSHLQKCEDVDVIWAMEAISHIFPPEDFFRLAFEKIEPGGVLGISDPNPMNILAWWRSVRIRGSLVHRPHRKFHDPHTGSPVDYGQENLLTASRLRRSLRLAGFSAVKIHFSGFMGSSLWPELLLRASFAPPFLRRVQKMARAIPGLNRLGTTYTLLASKP